MTAETAGATRSETTTAFPAFYNLWTYYKIGVNWHCYYFFSEAEVKFVEAVHFIHLCVYMYVCVYVGVTLIYIMISQIIE